MAEKDEYFFSKLPDKVTATQYFTILLLLQTISRNAKSLHEILKHIRKPIVEES